jgi:predicted enzyme related to lactoylglutathione lyase
MAKLIFINLPVSDLARATAFYQAIGAVKNAQFSDDTASCMVFFRYHPCDADDIRKVSAVHHQEDCGRQDDQPSFDLHIGR